MNEQDDPLRRLSQFGFRRGKPDSDRTFVVRPKRMLFQRAFPPETAANPLAAKPPLAAKSGRPSVTLWSALAALALLCTGLGVGASIAIRPHAHALATQVQPLPPDPAYPLADEAELLAAPTDRLTIWRFRAAPAVMVLLFPSAHAQALTLNRIAAFLEKAGLPRDHVVDDATLNAAIAAGHDEYDSYYYAHDYRAADLARFYATVAQDGIALRPEEQALHDLLDQSGMLRPSPFDQTGTTPPDRAPPDRAPRALISLPPSGTKLLDPSGRHAILEHELSHGVYFTDPAYAALVRDFWQAHMTETERAAFRRFLGHSGYDTDNDDLMRNEMQAYLLFTPDPRLFTPSVLHLGETTPARLRAALTQELPAGWLHDTAMRP